MMEKVILEQSLEDAEESILLHLGAKMCSEDRNDGGKSLIPSGRPLLRRP